MNAETFRRQWYFRPLKALYWGSLILLSAAVIILGFIGSDVEPAGFFWAGLLACLYWLVKRTFYSAVLGERFLPRRPGPGRP